MSGHKQLILISCLGITIAAAVAVPLVLSASGDTEKQLLVKRLFELAGPPDVPVKEPKKKKPQAPIAPTMKAIEGLPSEASVEQKLDKLMSAGLPSGLSEPYYGTWIERSVSDEATATLKTTLHRDGTVEIAAVLRSRDATSRSHRLSASGRWAMDGLDIVIVIDETDSPEIFAIGFVQVFGDSRVVGPDWTYTDTDGTSRVMRKH